MPRDRRDIHIDHIDPSTSCEGNLGGGPPGSRVGWCLPDWLRGALSPPGFFAVSARPDFTEGRRFPERREGFSAYPALGGTE